MIHVALRFRFAKAMKLMEERARVPLFLTYRAVGSGTGQKEFALVTATAGFLNDTCFRLPT